ncbi:MAG TPA: MMPL family transporter [Spirochaetota bacterium]|nr:MMPL family transporter [Spirochaetota bacterium]
MKNFFSKNFAFLKKRRVVSILIFIVSIVVIIFSTLNIKLDASIQSLFPKDKIMERAVGLTGLSPVADKIILYVGNLENEKDLPLRIGEINAIVEEEFFVPQKIKINYFNDNVLNNLSEEDKNKILSFYNKDENYYVKDKKLSKENKRFLEEIFKKINFTLKNAIPDGDDINKIMEYSSRNSLALFPHEWGENIFSASEIEKRLKKKEDYLLSTPFFSPNEEFFLDPLASSFDILKLANAGSSGKFFPEFGGVLSKDRKSYIKVFKSHFFSEDYENSEKIYNLDKKINAYAKKNNFTSFLYCSHLYYLDSFKSIQLEIALIFILSVVLTLTIFYLFFKRLGVLFYGFIPIVGGFAMTFLIIAIFKKEYGGIAFAFGSTTAGISIDYTIHYLSKLCLYPNLSELRKKLTFSMFLGFITTISAFFLLFFSKIKSLEEIAFFGFLGITFAFLLNYFVLQKLIPPEEYQCSLKKINIPQFGLKGFILWIIFMLAIIVGIFFSRFEDNIMNLDKKHKIMDKRANIIKTNFLESSESVFLVFTGENKDEILDKSLEALKYLNKEEISFLTPAIFMPSKNIIETRKKIIKSNFNKDVFNDKITSTIFDKDSFNLWISSISDIDSLKLSETPKYIREEAESMFVNWEGDDYLLIQINGRERSKKIKEILTQNKVDFFIVDAVNDSGKSLVDFEKKSMKLILISLFVVFIFLVIAYKNVIYAFIALMPPLVALLSTFAIATFTGKGFNIMHLSGSVVLLGIGVDYGIFMVGVFRTAHSEREIQNTFQSLFMCALTTLAGFAVLSFCSNGAVFSLGTTMFFGVVSALLTSYLTLPFLLKKIGAKSAE